MKILAFCGSLRAGSLNRKALRIAVDIARSEGAEVEEVDLATLDLPMFNEDLMRERFPEPVARFKQAVATSDILLIASPEYNHSIPAPLKNAIDWGSRKNSFGGKWAVILGVSNGPFGTVRMQTQLRQALSTVNVNVLAQPQILIRNGNEAFTPGGKFADPKTEQLLRKLIHDTLHVASVLKTEAETVKSS